jgi:hypothetical protein
MKTTVHATVQERCRSLSKCRKSANRATRIVNSPLDGRPAYTGILPSTNSAKNDNPKQSARTTDMSMRWTEMLFR